MGEMYDAVLKIGDIIARRNLPVFKTKGLIAIKAGLSLGLITPLTPDDPVKLKKLRDAARDVLQELV